MNSDHMARCAVCGKDTGPESPGGSETYNDQTYGFCDAKCKAEFDRNPERYGEKTATDAHG
jgi:YHS domain-containing protein